MANKGTGGGGERGGGLRLVRTGEKEKVPREKSVLQERYNFITALTASINSKEQDAMRSDLSRVVFRNEDAKKANDAKQVTVTLGQLFERFFWKKRQENGNNPITFNPADAEEFRNFYSAFFDTHTEEIKPDPFIKGVESRLLTRKNVDQPTIMDDVIEQQGGLPEGPPAIPQARPSKGGKVFKFSVDDRRNKDK